MIHRSQSPQGKKKNNSGGDDEPLFDLTYDIEEIKRSYYSTYHIRFDEDLLENTTYDDIINDIVEISSGSFFEMVSLRNRGNKRLKDLSKEEKAQYRKVKLPTFIEYAIYMKYS